MIILHQFAVSPFCDKVRRILQVKRVRFEVREVPTSRALFDIRKVNPIGKLPCLEHDGRMIADSTDIAYYLEEAFPDPPLVPQTARERTLCHMLEDWADESLYFYEVALRFLLPHNARRWLPELTRHDPPWLRGIAATLAPAMFRRMVNAQGIGRKPRAMIRAEIARHVDALDGLLRDGEWLVGGALTLADIAVFSQLSCIRGTDEGAEAIAARASVAAWMERVELATRAPSGWRDVPHGGSRALADRLVPIGRIST